MLVIPELFLSLKTIKSLKSLKIINPKTKFNVKESSTTVDKFTENQEKLKQKTYTAQIHAKSYPLESTQETCQSQEPQEIFTSKNKKAVLLSPSLKYIVLKLKDYPTWYSLAMECIKLFLTTIFARLLSMKEYTKGQSLFSAKPSKTIPKIIELYFL